MCLKFKQVVLYFAIFYSHKKIYANKIWILSIFLQEIFLGRPQPLTSSLKIRPKAGDLNIKGTYA